MSTGERIKELRGATSQAEFADILGIHKNTLGNYERGQRTPDVDFLALVSKKLGVSTHWLVFGEGSMYLTQAAQDANQPQPQQRPPAPPAPESELDYLRNENRELREENKGLRDENKELRQENRTQAKEIRELVEQNAELRIEVQALKLKPDHDDKTYEADDMQRSA